MIFSFEHWNLEISYIFIQFIYIYLYLRCKTTIVIGIRTLSKTTVPVGMARVQRYEVSWANDTMSKLGNVPRRTPVTNITWCYPCNMFFGRNLIFNDGEYDCPICLTQQQNGITFPGCPNNMQKCLYEYGNNTPIDIYKCPYCRSDGVPPWQIFRWHQKYP